MTEIASYLKTLADAGMIDPSDQNLEAWAREQGNLPPMEG
jgi:hypothetical protein